MRLIIFAIFCTSILFSNNTNAQCPPSKEKGIHVVQKKETLYSISKKYNLTVAQLCQLNGITATQVLPACAKLRVSGAAPIVDKPTDKPADVLVDKGVFVIPSNTAHIVKKGETMATIAAMYGFTEARLRAMNKLDWSYDTYIGEALSVTTCPTLEGPLASYDAEDGVILTDRATGEQIFQRDPNAVYDKVIHIVSAGETLTSIGLLYGMAPSEIAAMNDLSENVALRAGQRLTLENRKAGKSRTQNEYFQDKSPTSNTNKNGTANPAKTETKDELSKNNAGLTTINAPYMSADERDMLLEINLLRSNPAGYIPFVEEYMKNNPYGKKATVAAQELISELKETAPMSALEPMECIYSAARKHGEDCRRKGSADHLGSDNSWPWERVRKECPNMSDGNENLVGGPEKIREAVLMLLVDDGIPARGHRMTLLNPRWKYGACYKIGTVGKIPNYWVQNFGY